MALASLLLAAAVAVELPADIAGRCETWLCAGQSNMQRGWGCFNSTPEEKARVSMELAQLDELDVRLWNFADGSWTKLDRTNALSHCAIGISFGIRRARATGKPVALLYVAAGGAPTESFLSRATMRATDASGRPLYPTLAAMMADGREIHETPHFPCAWVAREFPRRKDHDSEAKWWGFGCLYERGIAPLRHLPLTGILWYQGESNATACIGTPDVPLDPGYMRETLRAVVAELRGDRKVPFLMFGLPIMDRPWEPYRTAQREVCAQMGAVYLDTFAAGLGDPHDVHPRNKIPFAELAAAAAERAIAEGAIE